MQICLVTPYSLTQVSGITAVVLDLARNFVARGHSSAIAAPGPAPATIPANATAWIISAEGQFANLKLAFRTARILWRNRRRWDLLHLHQGHPQTLVGALLARFLGRPALTTFHLLPPRAPGLRGISERVWIRLTLAASTKSIFVSHHTRSVFGHRGEVIYNGVDVEKVRGSLGDRETLRRELGLDGFVVAFAGRMARTKGYFDLLKAVRQVRDDGCAVYLLTTGEVPSAEREEVVRQVQELNLGVYLRDLGKREDHLQFLSAVDVFALPSYTEGFPMAILEAMAAGLPVVASRVGGIPEMVSDGFEGFLVNPGDVLGLASRIKELARNQSLRNSMASMATRKAKRFDLALTASTYLELYRDCISGQSENSISGAT